MPGACSTPSSAVSPLVAMTASLSSLRARKFQHTRTALIDTAADMCLSRGYENITVSQITAVVGVSPRTFSRYFARKDAVFAAVLDDLDDAVAAELRTSPAKLGPLAATRSAFGVVFARAHRVPFHGFSAERVVRIVRVVTACEALRHAAVGYRGPQVTAVLADRMSVDVEDPQMTLVMALIGVTVGHAFGVAVASGAPLAPEMIGTRVDQSFARVATLAADLRAEP